MKTAFVLSGGGAKGCFQVGVMKNLINNKGYKPSVIYGTSTGALQASGYAHIGINRLEQIWLALKDKSDVFSWNWWPHILTLGLTLDGKYNLNPLKKKLEAIEASPREPGINCEVVVTKVSLLTGEVKYCRYDEPDFLESVLASASVPFVNKPVKGEWVDGGVRDQIPLGQVRKLMDEGYERIVCVINNPIHINPESWKMPWFMPLFGILIRVADGILSCETWLDELRQIQEWQAQGKNIEVYMPDDYWMDTEEYTPAKIQQGIAMGYAALPIDLTSKKLV